MNETQKKVGLGVVIAAALGFAIWEGIGFFNGPQVTPTKVINAGFSKGHTGKGAMLAASGAQSPGDSSK